MALTARVIRPVVAALRAMTGSPSYSAIVAVHARGLVDAQGLGGERLVVGLLADRLADSLDAWLELLADVPAGVGLLLRP